MLVPACTIHLRPADRDEIEDEAADDAPAGRPDEDSEPGGGPETDEVDDEMLSPEEQAYEELLNVDPEELALKTMATSYAAAMVASLVETQIPEPQAADQAALEALVDQYAHDAGEAAKLWSGTPEALAMASDYMIPDFSCEKEPYGCPYTTECPYNGGVAVCVVTYCGDAQCPWCPWELGNLIFKSWCSYGCMKGGQIVAGAYILMSKWWGTSGGTECIYW